MYNFSVVIQAGGGSSRMGQDKALVPFESSTLIEYILSQIKGFGDEQIIITNRVKEYQRFGLPIFQDVIPGLGALGGIYTGIYHASYHHSIILACDMPFVNKNLLKRLIELTPGYDAVIPRLKPDEFAEPFRAVYAKTSLQSIEDAIESGQNRVISFFDEINIRFFCAHEIRIYDPEGMSFFNVNTPEDLAEAKNMAKKLEEREWNTFKGTSA